MPTRADVVPPTRDDRAGSLPCTPESSRIEQLFSSHDLHIIKSSGIDLGRMNDFILKTEAVGAKVSKLTLATARWAQTFAGDPDKQFLVEGCAYGFSWPSKDPPEFYEIPNFVKPEFEHLITKRLAEEVEHGRIVRANKDQVCGFAAIGVVDKQKSGFTKYRVIQDFSRPAGSSVNDNANPTKRKFTTFRQAMDLLRPNAFQCKIDLKDAYRSVPLAPEWWPRHAYVWKNQVYMDTRTPFGTNGAPAMFDRITQAVVRMMKAHGFPSTLGYLDDFWVLVAD